MARPRVDADSIHFGDPAALQGRDRVSWGFLYSEPVEIVPACAVQFADELRIVEITSTTSLGLPPGTPLEPTFRDAILAAATARATASVRQFYHGFVDRDIVEDREIVQVSPESVLNIEADLPGITTCGTYSGRTDMVADSFRAHIMVAVRGILRSSHQSELQQRRDTLQMSTRIPVAPAFRTASGQQVPIAFAELPHPGWRTHEFRAGRRFVLASYYNVEDLYYYIGCGIGDWTSSCASHLLGPCALPGVSTALLGASES
ncbi:uncharacterized protein LOC112268698 [Brachypodium distachyon]|uniref:Uncharacterized protein n=1 Tax=Brachypodium distachyon TaxID=15368 RepID=A0A2K2CT03_BRADI|nr:uncharacterized protein LOC112268698 [Brachypodium distachyon]PNT65153.1 hypothetical protein BRADI_4g37926v3 [Brachypodium distachyon]|eukprot:XP_024310422.1 uncharacterized protein LOC112268698 [Brachypodium distachyon]